MWILLNSFIPSVFADGDHAHSTSMSITESIMNIDTWGVVIVGSIVIGIFILGSAIFRPTQNALKHMLFWPICTVSLIVTIALLLQTVIKNIESETGGPVHWHADFRIFNCDQELDVIDPTGFLNRVGTPQVHEHNDKRLHVEGTLLKVSDASLGSFFDVIGGELTQSAMTIPTNTDVITVKNGDACSNEETGMLQVFVWQTVDEVASQQKLESFTDYVLSPHTAVPPGDCIIVEFGPEKEITEHICEQYSVAQRNGKLTIK